LTDELLLATYLPGIIYILFRLNELNVMSSCKSRICSASVSRYVISSQRFC